MQSQQELQHLFIIPDGNGRWATSQGLARGELEGRGFAHTRDIILECLDQKIPYLTMYVFSTENWQRPRSEVEGLLRRAQAVLLGLIAPLHAEGMGVRLQHLGNLEGLPPELQAAITHTARLTSTNTRMVLSLAINYGGRADLVQAFRRMLTSGLKAEEVTEETIKTYLWTAALPEPDLVIRTGGKQRTSNGLLWDVSYSEWWYSDLLWPEFGRDQLREAIQAYYTRNRRFGKV